jgi:hypothetical protein
MRERLELLLSLPGLNRQSIVENNVSFDGCVGEARA